LFPDSYPEPIFPIEQAGLPFAPDLLSHRNIKILNFAPVLVIILSAESRNCFLVTKKTAFLK
jgi:hypothetical protein